MTRIGVISDTHLFAPGSLPDWVFAAFAGVTMIVHAGDITSAEVIDDLAQIAPCQAVRGNMDGWECRFPPFRCLQIAGRELVVAHHLETARGQASTADSIIVYGHTHLADFRREGGLWLLNPGSPTLPRARKPPSVAVLEVSPENVHAVFKNPPHSSDE